MSCAIGGQQCPVSFEILGSGQDAAKLRQRLSCALGGLGFNAQITVHADSERAIALGATRDPAIIVNNQLLADGLPQTEVLDSLLRPILGLPSRATAAKIRE